MLTRALVIAPSANRRYSVRVPNMQPSWAFRAGQALGKSLPASVTRGGFDDGGTPAFRARQAATRQAAITRPFWAIARFIWLFPIVGTGAALLFVAFWLGGILLVGDAAFWSTWWPVAALAAVSISWERIVGKSGFGAARLAFFQPPYPVQTPWDGVKALFRGVFVALYCFYAFWFWAIVAIAVTGHWKQILALVMPS